jgi:hypothetical protein
MQDPSFVPDSPPTDVVVRLAATKTVQTMSAAQAPYVFRVRPSMYKAYIYCRNRDTAVLPKNTAKRPTACSTLALRVV